jgi:hypothetical protein
MGFALCWRHIRIRQVLHSNFGRDTINLTVPQGKCRYSTSIRPPRLPTRTPSDPLFIQHLSIPRYLQRWASLHASRTNKKRHYSISSWTIRIVVSNRQSNLIPPQYKSWLLPLEPNCSLNFYFTRSSVAHVLSQRFEYLVHNLPKYILLFARISNVCFRKSGIGPIHIIPSYLPKMYFNIVHPPTSWSSQWSLSFWLSNQYPLCIHLLPIPAIFPAHIIVLDLFI